MRSDQPPRRSRTRHAPVAAGRPRIALAAARRPRIALALAGGGPLGAIYEVGALCALEHALVGLELAHLDHYVGVSAGAFLAAAMANGVSARALHAAFIAADPLQAATFDPAWLMAPAYGEFVQRGLRLPGLLAEAGWQVLRGRGRWTQSLERLGAAIPTGVFSSEGMHARLERFFVQSGLRNDFRQLSTRLTLVATDLDSGDAAPFGSPGWDTVPITRAVQASAALPGMFPPVEINGRWYVDGALKKTLHASVALEHGVDLLLCLNPLVPLRTPAPGNDTPCTTRVVDGGLPAVMGQTFRSMIHSRVELGMRHYAHRFPDTDIVLLEPARHDPVLQQANTFGYARRSALADHAFLQTLAWLKAQSPVLAPMLRRHGITLDPQALQDLQTPLSARLATACAGAPSRPLAQALSALDTVLGRLGTLTAAPAPRRTAAHG